MAIVYDPSAARAVMALMDDGSRGLLADRAVAALRGLGTDPGDARFRRRSYAPHVDWGFVVRARDETLLILWDWDSEREVARVRYIGPDLV
jgi:hypothetical protein